MPARKVSLRIDEEVWRDLQDLARKSQQSVSGLVTEAIREYVARRRVRPEVLQHLEDSIERNEELGRRLSR